MGMILGCIPVAIILYIVGKGFLRHMVEENSPGQEPWEVRNPEHYGVPPEIHAAPKSKH